MAKQIITTTEYTDDLDGTVASGTVAFGFDGSQYEIDLSKANGKAFEKAMALYIGHARKVKAPRSRASAPRGKASAKYDLSAVRQWAAANGYNVSERGRVAQTVLDAYDAAN